MIAYETDDDNGNAYLFRQKDTCFFPSLSFSLCVYVYCSIALLCILCCAVLCVWKDVNVTTNKIDLII